ncbi:MAG: hypothetical protein WAZ19_02555, partial [Anaerolineae bacterium]
YTKQETASSLVKSLVPMFPVPSDRRSKIESQIKQGINRVYNEYKKGSEPGRGDEDDENTGDSDVEETSYEEPAELELELEPLDGSEEPQAEPSDFDPLDDEEDDDDDFDDDDDEDDDF